MYMGLGVKESCLEEKEAFMKIVRKTTWVTTSLALVWGDEGTGTGATHCHWSAAVLCWPDQGFQLPWSWDHFYLGPSAGQPRTATGLTCMQITSGHQFILPAGYSTLVSYKVPVMLAHPRPHWDLTQTPTASGSMHQYLLP